MTIGESSALYPRNSVYYNSYNKTLADRNSVNNNSANNNSVNKTSAGNAVATGNPVNPSDKTEKQSTNPDDVKKPGRRSSPADCKTCAERKYQDGSDENNVSFKSAAHISPESAASKVRAHENEHVSNAYKKASQNDGKVLNASVTIHTSVCPECGRIYVAGGVTKTTIKYTNEDNPYTKNQKSLDEAKYKGANIDYAA